MRSKVIYKKQFPKWEMPETDDLLADNAPSSENDNITFEEIMRRIYKDMVYVLLPNRQEKAKEFIETAIEVSELYEMDIEIEQHLSHISVSYYFDCGGGMKHLIDIISKADDVAFFRPKEGCDIIMSLDFYTHAEYRNGRRIEP